AIGGIGVHHRGRELGHADDVVGIGVDSIVVVVIDVSAIVVALIGALIARTTGREEGDAEQSGKGTAEAKGGSCIAHGESWAAGCSPAFAAGLTAYSSSVPILSSALAGQEGDIVALT